MKIVIVGPGAMGCLIAAFLAHRTKEEVCLLDSREERAKVLGQNGISVEGISGPFTVKVPVSAFPRTVGPADLVIICTKSYSTEDACKHARDLVGENTAILTLQNGIGNVQVLADQFGEERVLAGITNHGATLLGAGRVRHAGKGDTIIGRLDGKVTHALRTIQTILTKAGLETRLSKDIESVIWSKLVINVGINALTAITRLKNGMLVECDGTRELLKSAVSEAVRISKRKRVKLVYDDPIQKVESVCKATAGNISSMLQDVVSAKRTEIDYINGAIVRQGKNLGIPTPVNDTLTHLVKTIETTYGAQLSRKE
jgi:2-dehydropantoate 2-reductase